MWSRRQAVHGGGVRRTVKDAKNDLACVGVGCADGGNLLVRVHQKYFAQLSHIADGPALTAEGRANPTAVFDRHGITAVDLRSHRGVTTDCVGAVIEDPAIAATQYITLDASKPCITAIQHGSVAALAIPADQIVTHRGCDTALAGNHKSGLNARSEEHTSELQSRPQLVCCLLLEKKKTNLKNTGK